MENKMTIRDKIIGGLAVVALFGCYAGLFVPKLMDEREVRENGYIVPRKFEIKMTDLDMDGRKETIASYMGKAYLLKSGTNGVAYLEQIKGLEIKVEK